MNRPFTPDVFPLLPLPLVLALLWLLVLKFRGLNDTKKDQVSGEIRPARF